MLSSRCSERRCSSRHWRRERHQQACRDDQQGKTRLEGGVVTTGENDRGLQVGADDADKEQRQRKVGMCGGRAPACPPGAQAEQDGGGPYPEHLSK